MRILFNYYAGGGGGLGNILELVKSFAIHRPDVTLIVPVTGKADFGPIYGISNICFLVVESGYGELSRLVHGLWRTQQIAKEVNADMIWSVNLGAYIRGAIPQVLSINNAYQVYPVSMLRYHPAGVVRAFSLRLFSWLSIRASCGLMFQTAVMRDKGLKQARRGTQAIVAGKAVDYELTSRHSSNAEMVEELIHRVNRGKRFTYLYAASLFPHKNHEVLINAMEVLRERGRDIVLVLTVDAESLIDAFGMKVRRLIDAGVIVPLGWVAKNSLRELYDSCDACVMPSVLESLSSSHLEAMAWARPQIAADLSYAHDLCKDAALYVNPFRPHDWADAMEKLAINANARSKLIEAGLAVTRSFPLEWKSIAVAVHEFLNLVAESKLQGGC